ncbi:MULTISPECIES: catalase [Comamonas]|uniref:Catalase n=1 Tax=Comamonas terrigena TaxID=32013 RepID=A0A2A7UVH3_COMTR|nr:MULTISPECIES: catalase [Comamonas]MBD9530518.1 catalase [Comamonas sp. CMM01]PEH89191.1 catalase HPII [Comamonas terrigena]BBL24303.1 catalase [Comamonas terrigena NBRC 13299]SUY72098.1 Catalase HPII [Comamonas terrigena]
MTKPAAKKSSAKPSVTDLRGNAGELQQQAGGSHPAMTTQQGIPVPDNQNSLKAYERGPSLLEDFILREKITHFDHERIPERIVHARGTGAHGYFELSQSLAKYTTAQVLTETGKKVPIFVRFSTVAGGAGSVDTPRDVRGFAIKFYTDEGNWDLVGNNVPVFFIQDAMKFPDLVHAVKMEPDRGFPQAASAHDTFWDFISLMPESMHMVMWIMSDRTIPRSLRTIEGFGVHSFRLINAQGDSTFVKFHWRPELGIQSTVWDEALALQAADNDFHRRDLFEALEAGQAPAWELSVQLFTEEQASKLPYDHLDPTKIIPEEIVPLQKIGRFVLNRWPDNFFAETEQVAFCPANVPPGIDFSNDPLLQGRLFSYLDTQLSRLGGPNFAQIPINAPKCPFAHHQRDGHMQMQVPKGRVAYEPSSLQPDSPRASLAQGSRSFAEAAVGSKGRVRPESFADHYSQARMFFRSQSVLEQAHITSALVFELSKVQTPHVRSAVVSQLRVIDEELGQRVAKGLGLSPVPDAVQPAVPVQDLPVSPATRIIDRMKPTLEGRCVAILVDEGSNAESVAAMRKALEAAKASVKLIAPRLGGIRLSDGKEAAIDGQLAGSPSAQFDAVASIIPLESGKKLAKQAAAQNWFRDAFGHLKAIAACKGTHAILDAAGVKPDAGVVDPSDTKAFVKAAVSRIWEREPTLRSLA